MRQAFGPGMYLFIAAWYLVITTIVFSIYYPTLIPQIFLGSIQAFVGIALVVHAFSRNPKPVLMSVLVEPEDENKNIVADEKYLVPVRRHGRPDRPIVRPAYVREMKSFWIMMTYLGLAFVCALIPPLYAASYVLSAIGIGYFTSRRLERKIECKRPPRKLRVAFDIGNAGLTGVTVHEIQYQMIKPKIGVPHIISLETKNNERKYLRPHERITSEFRFPENKQSRLKPGYYEFRVILYTTKMESKLHINIHVSDDMKTIRFSY